MRIISGKYRGRRIPVARNFPARPTTDFAKESLFNVLANQFDFEGLTVLDLFAGTGGIGFEFASRGAARVDLVEIHPRSASFLHQVVRKLDLAEVNIHKADAFSYIESIQIRYDIIFADPPFDHGRIHEIPDIVLNSGTLAPESVLILEHGKNHGFQDHTSLKEMRKYGSVHFSIFGV